MLRPDAAFLEEVDDFLVSFGLSPLPTQPELTDSESGSTASPVKTVSSEKEAPKPEDRKRSRKKTPKLDADAKRELEKEKDRKRRSTYRERRRVEKEALLLQVGELSTHLTELQSAKQGERSLASSVWEKVAMRQLEARVNSEEKQCQLLRAIGSRAGFIQQVQGLVDNRLADQQLCSKGEETESFYKQKRIRLEPSDAEFYEAFFRDIATNYAQTDAVFQTHGMESTDAEGGGPRKQWKQHEDGYVFIDKHVMPFNFQQVCAFASRVSQAHHRQEDRQAFDGVTDTENTSAYKFRITTRLKSGRKVSVMQRSATRQYIEKNRSMVLWRTFTEGEGVFRGMHSIESGWCISTPISENRTLLRTIMRSVPMHFNTTLALEPEAKQFINVVLDAGVEDSTEICSRLEKLLLQDK